MRLQRALALVSTPRAPRAGERSHEQRHRDEYRGGQEQDDERDEQYPAGIVKAALQREPFACVVRIADDRHFHFGRARPL